MRFVAKVIFVVGIIGFKAAEQSAYSCNDCYLTLEFSLTYILLFTDKLAACARWEQPSKPVIVAICAVSEDGSVFALKIRCDQSKIGAGPKEQRRKDGWSHNHIGHGQSPATGLAGYSAGMKVKTDQGINQRDESGEAKDSACRAATKESSDTRDGQDAT